MIIVIVCCCFIRRWFSYECPCPHTCAYMRWHCLMTPLQSCWLKKGVHKWDKNDPYQMNAYEKWMHTNRGKSKRKQVKFNKPKTTTTHKKFGIQFERIFFGHYANMNDLTGKRLKWRQFADRNSRHSHITFTSAYCFNSIETQKTKIDSDKLFATLMSNRIIVFSTTFGCLHFLFAWKPLKELSMHFVAVDQKTNLDAVSCFAYHKIIRNWQFNQLKEGVICPKKRNNFNCL